jgi:hypothetical protein
MTLSVISFCIECHYAVCPYAECRVSFIVMLNVVLLSVCYAECRGANFRAGQQDEILKAVVVFFLLSETSLGQTFHSEAFQSGNRVGFYFLRSLLFHGCLIVIGMSLFLS